MEQTKPNEGLRYCLYARKSSESDEKQAMSIDSQIKEMLQLAERDGLEVTEMKRESHSAKATGQRPVFNEMVREIQSGKFNAILAWAPDRLSRNAGDLGIIVDLLDQKALVEIRTYGQRFTDTPSEKFLFMILGAQGKLENDQKGVNVKRGLRAKCEMGLWPAVAPTGYLNGKWTGSKNKVVVDPNRAHMVKQAFEKVANDQWSMRKVFRWLRDSGFTTVNNKTFWLSNVHKMLTTPFYYGEFEYPAKSGTWYRGVHEPIITKELYMAAQKHIRMEQHMKYENKEFAFTKLMKCGSCGSGITAEEKFKKLANGDVAKYIYYGCTRSKDHNCKGGYLREQDLILHLIKIIDQVSLDELGLRQRIQGEMERYQKFQQMIGTPDRNMRSLEVDMRSYARYVLQEGSVHEKRELLANLRSRIIYKNKEIHLER